MNIEELILQMNFSSIAWQIITPLIFSLADIITGYIQAIINQDLDSQKMREGLLHKCLLIIIVILSFVIQFCFNLPFIPKVICGYIIIMEVVSIMENLTKAGIDLRPITNMLKIKETKEGEK